MACDSDVVAQLTDEVILADHTWNAKDPVPRGGTAFNVQTDQLQRWRPAVAAVAQLHSCAMLAPGNRLINRHAQASVLTTVEK